MRITIEDTGAGEPMPQVSTAATSPPMGGPPTGPAYAGATDAGPAPTGPQQAAQSLQPGAAAPSGEPMIVERGATSAGAAPSDI
jgi:hypothetical protein